MFYKLVNITKLAFLGHGIVAATSSIPSKYQTIVTDNADRKGFNAQAKRFQAESHFVSLYYLP